jgi:hypothetical protein
VTDAFESAVQRVAREKNGGPVDASLFWEIVLAQQADNEREHHEIKVLLGDHVRADAQRRVLGVIVAGFALILAAFAAFEWYDQEHAAAIASLMLTVAIVLGGWYMASRRK